MPGEAHDRTCPQCGHMSETGGRGESLMTSSAERFASVVATWRFAISMLIAVGAWVLLNVVAEPFQPYPVIIFAVISAALATVQVFQGPVLMAAQRHSAENDRRRVDELQRVCTNTAADVGRIEAKLDALAELARGR